MKNSQQVYVAFSIAGTNAFITANKVVKNFDPAKLPEGFKVTQSRRPNYDAAKDGIKLSWDRLNTKDGKPLRSVPMILGRFAELAKDGWTINKKAFVEKHYVHQYRITDKRGTRIALSRRQYQD